jgi:hypothetical protein
VKLPGRSRRLPGRARRLPGRSRRLPGRARSFPDGTNRHPARPGRQSTASWKTDLPAGRHSIGMRRTFRHRGGLSLPPRSFFLAAEACAGAPLPTSCPPPGNRVLPGRHGRPPPGNLLACRCRPLSRSRKSAACSASRSPSLRVPRSRGLRSGRRARHLAAPRARGPRHVPDPPRRRRPRRRRRPPPPHRPPRRGRPLPRDDCDMTAGHSSKRR